MLERAAGCLDFAGPGFRHQYRGILRRKKSLDATFWKYKLCEADIRLEFDDDRCQSSRNRETSIQSAHGTFLDFLYPRSCLLGASNRPLRPKRGNAYFQKRRGVTNLVRAYSQAPGSNSQSANAISRVNVTRNSSRAHNSTISYGIYNWDKRFSSRASRDRVYRDYDRMWKLWQNGDLKPQSRSHLMAQLAGSDRPLDIKRALSLLQNIDPNKRTTNDYEIIIKPLLNAGHLSAVELICEEAVGQGVEVKAWHLALKIAFECSRWQDISQIWIAGHSAVSQSLPSILDSVNDLANQVASFLEFLEGVSPTSSDLEFSSHLIDFVFTSNIVMAEITVETVLSLTQRSSNLGFLTQEHYNYAIATSLRIETRPSKVMGLVLYRNFRWHLSTCKPSQRLLQQLLETLASIKTHHGVQYLLDEFSHFYGNPSVEAYKSSLTAFSRSGDASKTQETFNKLVELYGTSTKNPEVDHKTPRTPRWVIPLLHAHARSGDYPSAEREFHRISHIYKVHLNRSCWNALISAHANARNHYGAFKVWRRMHRKGINPDWHTYGTMMGLCAKLGDIENTIALCRMAEKRQGRMPTAIMDTLVEVYCRNQRLDEAEQVAETCLTSALSGSRTRMWNVLLWSHAFRADLDSVSRIHNRMKQAGIDFDEMTYSALMLCFVIIGRPDSARRLLRGLQRGRRIQATEFHYTLVLYGYVREGNRDMIYLIYKEIEERFGNPGMSARLLMMRSALGRETLVMGPQTDDLADTGYRLALSEDLLFRAVFDFDQRQFANKYPRPATSSLPKHEAFPSLFYEPVLKTYGSEGMHFRTEKLLKEYAKDMESSIASGQRNVVPSLRFLSVLMEVYSQADKFETVQNCWELALERAAKMIKRISLNQSPNNGPSLSAPEDLSPPTPEHLPQPSLRDLSDNLSESSFEDVPALSSSEDLASDPETRGARFPPYPEEDSIIPSQRFVLSRHFSLYMVTMGKMGQASRVPELVEDYQKRGFRMTSQNWLTYVRVLAASNAEAEQLLAFTTFERIFMPHFPGWRKLARGVQLKPPGVPSTLDLLDNRPRRSYRDTLGKKASRLWSRLNPTWMHPTYNVMIYLAATLKDFRERSLTEGRQQMDTLSEVAPLTLEAIELMPHLREKFQGVLLRNQIEQGDVSARRRQKYVWTGGILGVGGTPRPEHPLEEREAYLESPQPESDMPSSDQPSDQGLSQTTGADEGEPEDHADAAESTLEPRDEHDIETETLLTSRSRELGINPVQEEEDSDRKGEPPLKR
jgi:pentatricopeptide repeat-containing protein PET309